MVQTLINITDNFIQKTIAADKKYNQIQTQRKHKIHKLKQATYTKEEDRIILKNQNTIEVLHKNRECLFTTSDRTSFKPIMLLNTCTL